MNEGEVSPSHAPKLAASAAVGTAALMFATGATMQTVDAPWRLPWAAMGVAYLVAAWAIRARTVWARGFAIGLGLWGVALNVEALVMLSPYGLPAAPMTVGAMLFFGMGLALQALLTGAALKLRRADVSTRAVVSLVLASGALPCALIYGLAPQSSWLVSVAVVAAASLVVAGGTGIAKGKTWGLLAQIAGAASLAATLPFASELGWLAGHHPFLPTGNPLALRWLGIGAVMLASGATLPFLGPIVAYLLGRQKKTAYAVPHVESAIGPTHARVQGDKEEEGSPSDASAELDLDSESTDSVRRKLSNVE
jgi:hypothetical protein